jgi:hypothetical protein
MVHSVCVWGTSSLYPAMRTCSTPGRLPERPMGADCKSVGLRLRRFESCTCHPGQRHFSQKAAIARRAALSRIVTARDKLCARGIRTTVQGSVLREPHAYRVHNGGGGCEDRQPRLTGPAAAAAGSQVGLVNSSNQTRGVTFPGSRAKTLCSSRSIPGSLVSTPNSASP